MSVLNNEELLAIQRIIEVVDMELIDENSTDKFDIYLRHQFFVFKTAMEKIKRMDNKNQLRLFE